MRNILLFSVVATSLAAFAAPASAQQGATLYEQLTSYLGGCVLPFLGDAAGFAQSPADLPANPGECSTIQLAFHNP